MFSINCIEAQLGFCNGNSGDPIFSETFGEGTTNIQLPSGTTSYGYSNSTPSDGFYTVSSNTGYYDWHNVNDHTPGDTNGRSLIINADYTSGEFFRTTVSGLCENTSYEFSSWLINLLPASGCGGNGIPINVKFQIWDITDTNLLASGDTENIVGTNSPNWQQFALTFQTFPTQSEVILKMINNGSGGCGNDLAIDDIVFKTCGDFIDVIDNNSNANLLICESETPFSTLLTANPDFSIYTTHFYQWQESTDGIVWVDIVGEINQTYTVSSILSTKYYRVKVAEAEINLNNDSCNTLSENFEITVIPQPNAPVSSGLSTFCRNEIEALEVDAQSEVTVNWYDAEIGGNLLAESTNIYYTEASGTYYAEAVSTIGNCISNTRTPITLTIDDIPVVYDEEVWFCENTNIRLFADVANANYVWSTGENTPFIDVDQSGIFTVEVTNTMGCSAVKTITVNQIDTPIIDDVISDGSSIVISTINEGNFEYSIDGIHYQLNATFYNVEGGLYTIFVRERNGCGIVEMNYIHFWIPKYFTPNGDNINDTFNLKGIENYESSEVFIFDRFGRLIVSSKNAPLIWDGTFNGNNLQSSDYWYYIKIEDQVFQGHFTLKR